MIQILQLGVLAYREGLELQRVLVERRKAGAIGDVLLLLEHEPVITLGRNSKAENILASPEVLAQQGVEVHECDRGGDVTYHGPGQLVGYPIFDLRDGRDEQGRRTTIWPVEFVRRMEEALIQACSESGVACERIAGLTGVWTANPDGQSAKIAAIGVHVSRGVTSHGFALNVNNDLEAFKLIVPCGLGDRAVTSLQKELGREVALAEVISAVARGIGKVFSREIHWLSDRRELTGAEPQDLPMKPPREVRQARGEEELFLA